LKGNKASIIVIAVAILIVVGMYFTVITEKKEKIKDKQEEYKDIEAKLSKTIAVVKRKKEAAKKLKIVSAKWNQAKKMLPTEASISTLLTTLTKQSSNNEVKIKHLKPLGQNSKGKYDEIRIEMQVQGSYHKIGSFLASLNNMERIVNIRDLKLSPVSSKEEGMLISASFNLLTYISKGGKVEG